MEPYIIYVFISALGLGCLFGFIPEAIRRRSKDLEKSRNVLVRDLKGRQLYVHESHILMAGLLSATECINCGGNSLSTENLEKLLIPCSMELSVYDGNSKFKHSKGETNV